MLKIFRKEGVQKKILWFLATIIITSFVFFGTVTRLRDTSSSSHAGKVFGKKISLLDFDKHYKNTRDQALLIHGEDFFKMSPFLNLENETWDRIILLQEAKRRGIRAKDEEVVEFLKTLKIFQRENEFDNLLYNDLLKFVFKRTPRDFEEGIREQLTIMKLFEQVTSSLNINEKDIREAFRKENEKIQVSYILFPPSDYTNGIQISDEETKTYFEANPQEFMTPPAINVQYISLDYPAGAKDEEKKTIKDKTYEISLKTQAGDKLETIAKAYSLNIKESGFFNMNQPNLTLGWSYDTLEKIFNLTNDQVSEPIETPTGFQFLSIKERRNASQPTFESIKAKVADAIKTRKGFEVAQQKASDAAKQIQEKLNASTDATFTSAAGSLNLKTQQTPIFNRGQYLPVIGLSKEFQNAAYDLTEKDKLSGAVATAKGYCILYRDQVIPVEEAAFQKEKDKYASTLITEKRNQMIVDFMTEARLRADVQNNLPKPKSAP